MNETPDTKQVHWLNLRYTERQCPGLREALASAPQDQQSALVRGILYQWFLVHKNQGTLEQAITTALNGPGVRGQRDLRRRQKGAKARPAARPNQPEPVTLTPPAASTVQSSEPTQAPPQAPPPAPPPAPRLEPEQPPAADTAASALFNMFDD